MTTPGQTQALKSERLQEEKPQQEVKSDEVQIPTSWQLTQQQKDFIELFSADDHIK